MNNCLYCCDGIGGGKKEMKEHLTYCEYYTITERALVLFDKLNAKWIEFSIRALRKVQPKIITAAKKVFPRLAIGYLTLGIKTARYIEGTLNKWSTELN